MEQLNKNKLNISTNDLWKNCILSSLAHAIGLWQYPELSYEQSWDRFNCSINDSMGTRGTITFYNDNTCIGAFRNSDDINSKNTDLYKKFLQEMPDDIENIAKEEAFQYLLDYVGEEVQPLVTLVFWSEGDELVIIDPYDYIGEDEINEINKFLLPYNELIQYLQEYKDLSSSNIILLEELYEIYLKKENPIILTKEQIKLIDCDNNDDLKESIISFKELDIILKIDQL